MKFFLLLPIILFFSPSFLPAQPCNSAIEDIDLAANNVRVRLLTGGDFWWNGDDGRYIVPKVPLGVPEVSSLFAGSLWMGGFDAGGVLFTAAQTYGRPNNFDYWPGPISIGPNPTNQQTCANWDEFFSVTSEEIEAHIADLWDNGEINGPVPTSILGWPGRGNPQFVSVHSFSLPDQDLAPFYDHNGNGAYEPLLGDYPLVKGDESIWWVYNDAGDGNIHRQSEGDVLRMEIQANAFAYSSDTAYIDNTTFYEFKLIYKRIQPLDSVYIGLWVDPDLGCYVDDYIGCNPEEKLAFAYNGDDYDDDPCTGGVNGYQEEIPIVGIKVLKAFETPEGEEAPFAHFTYYLNPGIDNPPDGLTDPDEAIEYYNYLSGSWKDGTPFSQGGNGYNPGADPYPYVFDGSDFDGQPWTECNAGMPPGDRRFLMSFGPMSLSTGDIREFAFAVVWKADQEYPCPDLTDFTEEADLVEDFYIRKTEELLTGIAEEENISPFVQVAPNPMQESLVLSVSEQQAPIRDVLLYSSNGQLVRAFRGLNTYTLSLQRDGLLSGIYFYKVYLQDGRQSQGKLVVY